MRLTTVRAAFLQCGDYIDFVQGTCLGYNRRRLRNRSPRVKNSAFIPGVVLAALSAVATGVSAQTAALQGNAEAARNKNSMCIGCHGIPEYRTAFPAVYPVPMIAGQSQGYIVSALKEYRAGERSHPSMRGVAGSLSDQDIADLAAYYSAGKAK